MLDLVVVVVVLVLLLHLCCFELFSNATPFLIASLFELCQFAEHGNEYKFSETEIRQ